MMAKRYGRIVTCSSVMGTIGDSHMAPYCAAKAGVIGLTRAAAIELDPYNICVNSICPSGRDGALGPVGTRLSGPAEGNAPLVAYLASEEASWITGHVFDDAHGRIGLYTPMVPFRLIEQSDGYTLEELRTAIPRMFDPLFSIEPRQRPRLVPAAGEMLERLPEGMSPKLGESFTDRPAKSAWTWE